MASLELYELLVVGLYPIKPLFTKLNEKLLMNNATFFFKAETKKVMGPSPCGVAASARWSVRPSVIHMCFLFISQAGLVLFVAGDLLYFLFSPCYIVCSLWISIVHIFTYITCKRKCQQDCMKLWCQTEVGVEINTFFDNVHVQLCCENVDRFCVWLSLL